MTEKWHALSLEDVTRTLETDAERGLTSAEVAKRQERFGFNELKERPPVSFWTRLLDQLKGFVVIILIVASLISAALGDFIEAAGIMAIVVLNAAIGVIQESTAEAALAALKKMAAPDAQVIRDGHRTTVPSRELVPGDVVSVRCKYGERSARTRSSGRISHETAPVTDYFEVNHVAITEKLINICR